MSRFRSGARLGARLSQTNIHPADELAIATVAEEVLARIRETPEETFRTVIRNALASKRHSEWFEGVLDPYENHWGKTTTMATEWRDDLFGAVFEYLKRGRGLQPYWATRSRSLTVLVGGCAPASRRRRRRRLPRLRLVQGGAQ